MLETCQADFVRDVATCQERAQIEAAAATRVTQIRLNAATQKGEIRLKGCNRELRVTETALETAEGLATRKWFEAPSLWFWGGMTAGVIAGFALATASVWGVSQLTQDPLRPAL